MKKCINNFHTNISVGPVYVCTCCYQTWFRHSVSKFNSIKFTTAQADFCKDCITGHKSFDGQEWLCHTCCAALKRMKIPKLSTKSKMRFPSKPNELVLHELEERLLSLRIPFMQIRELPRGGQLSIRGNVVNVPVDIQPTIKALPRQFDESVTVPVRLKKKLSFKTCDFTQNVRPQAVVSGLHWLMQNSELYKDSGVQIDDEWLNTIIQTESNVVQEYFDIYKTCKKNQATVDNEHQSTDDLSDHFSEVDETDITVGNADTLVDRVETNDIQVYTFAPGEGQHPLSLYEDMNAEYLAFPTIYCGQKRPDNNERCTCTLQ